MTRAALPDQAARETALDLSRHVLTMAPAGSGKTGLLVLRLLRALAAVDEPEQVVAITFTNKAAAEIRARVAQALASCEDGTPPRDRHTELTRAAARAALTRSRERGWDLPSHPARVRALTIDGFNAQFAAQLPLLSGLGGPMAVADDPQALYIEAITRLFGDLEDEALPADLREALERLLRMADNRLDLLIRPLSDLLARREQWLPRIRAGERADGAEQEQQALQGLIVARLQQFENHLGAADRAELAALLREGSGQHELLAWAAELDGWPPAGAENVALLRKLAALLLTSDGKNLRKTVDVRSGFVAQQRYKDRMVALLKSLAGNDALCSACAGVLRLPDAEFPEELRQLQRALLRVLTQLAAHLAAVNGEQRQTDFTGIALAADQALNPDDGYSEALLAADRRIRHLLVDEMQDTSEAQVRLLELLTLGWQPGDGRSLFMVGDPQQSIYAFRKAEVRRFLELWERRRLGELTLECVRLSANFRSDPALVDWFNSSFTEIFPARSDPWTGVVAYARSDAILSATGGAVRTQVQVEAQSTEGERAARQAQELLRAHPGERVAVLARARAHLETTLLWLRKLGVPYACQDIDPLAALPAVRDYLALARALWHAEDRLSWAVLLRAPFVGMSWADLIALSRGRTSQSWPQRLREADLAALSAEGRARLERLQSALAAVDADAGLRGRLAERSEALWHALGGPGAVSGDELRDVRSAMRLLREHAPAAGIADLERFERSLGALFGEPSGGTVQVLTIHRSKGLEFEHVLLVGCGSGAGSEHRPLLHLLGTPAGDLLVPRPSESAEGEAPSPSERLYDCVHALARERRHNELLRLLYVAATRARRSLHLFVTLKPDADGAGKIKKGSFAELLERVLPPAQQGEVTKDDAETSRIPLAPRLPLEFRFETETDLYRPRERRTLKPSEAVLTAHEDRRDEDEVYAQLVGTLFHEAMQRVTQEGLKAWADAGASRRAALAAGLRRRGLPEPQVESAVARVLELLGRALAGERGRWLLEEKSWARSEYHLAGWRAGQWLSAVIDRCFADADGTLWVVDYKTSAQPQQGAALENYVNGAKERYRDQLRQYADLLAALRPGARVKSALYFPDADRLVEL